MAKKLPAKAVNDSKRQAQESGAPQIVRANVKREVVESTTFVSLYANDTQIQLSPWDIRLIFGLISEPATVERPVIVKTIGEVRMSPQHAKKVVQILERQLTAYENALGSIPVPD